MKKKQWLALALAAMLCGSALGGSSTVLSASELENMIPGGDFSEGIGTWSTYLEGGEASQTVNEQGQMVIDITDIGQKDYAVQAYVDGFSLQEGCVYALSFDAVSSVERTLEWRVQLNGGDYHEYASDLVTVGTEMTHIEAVFTMEEASDPAPRFCLNLGFHEGCPEDLNAHTLCFDNFTLTLLDDSQAAAEEEKEDMEQIHLDQVGYLPNGLKQAVLRSEAVGGSFEVVNEQGESVYRGETLPAVSNTSSGETAAIADFSELTEPGTYTLRTETCGESLPFQIGEDVYEELSYDALHMFYLQRCGAVEDETFGHEACHTQAGEIYGSDGKSIQSTGGWHDAGDYGRYVVAGAKAVADLLLTYENYRGQFDQAFLLPESTNGLPDLLNEVKYELDWMLTMQDPETGGVYHKITGEVFPDVIPPQEETATMVVSPISTTATGDFAAVMAMAARIYPDEEYRQQCLSAAKKAWAYLKETPSDGVGFKNPEGIVTGEYDDSHDVDERFWAAAELYRTTGESVYDEAAQQMDLSEIPWDLGWQSVGVYGMYAYLKGTETPTAFTQELQERLLALAGDALTKADAEVYGAALSSEEYIWGSNMLVADRGMLFLMAEEFSQNEAYVAAAQKQLHYLLGTNTTSYCFVTGYGSVSPEHPHHRPSQYAGQAVKGMLVGGPDSYLEDPYAANVLTGLPPAACYADDDQTYSCNEVTIYWNSPLVYLLAGIQAAE